MLLKLLSKFSYFILLLFITTFSYSQVGIGTITPRGALDVASTTQGFVLPQVSLASTIIQTAINPQGGIIPAGTLVYNDTTASTGATAVTPGMYYWNGTIWVSLDQVASNDWSILGNTGTNATTNFLGTTDATALTFRTGNDERFRIPDAEQVHALSRGTSALPFYSWEEDPNTGMWIIQNDELAFSAGAVEFLRFRERGQDETVFNINGSDIDFRIESDTETNMFFVDGAENEVGIKTADPQATFHIADNTSTIRIDAFSSTNANNNGIDDAVIYVDANGDLLIKPSLIQNQMPEDNALTFSPAPTLVTSTDGNFAQQTIYNTSFTLTQDALVEIVYQIGVGITDRFGIAIDDGQPRQYGTAILINGTIVGYTSEAYTSNPDAVPGGRTVIISSGTFFLNGNGYAELTGAAGGTVYNVQVIGFVAGGRVENGGGSTDAANTFGIIGEFGGNLGLDRFQIITHY